MLLKTDGVYFVHLDRKDEPSERVHIMVGEEEENLNLTECGQDAGVKPQQVSLNSTTAGDLCQACCKQFAQEDIR